MESNSPSNGLTNTPKQWLISIMLLAQVIDDIRHSVSAIHSLPPEIQLAARMVYYRGIRLSFLASACFGFVAATAALFTRGKGLHRSSEA